MTTLQDQIKVLMACAAHMAEGDGPLQVKSLFLHVVRKNESTNPNDR